MSGHDDALASLQAAGRLPSVSAAVARGGTPVWQGCLNVLPDRAVTSASAYRIGSITKTLTAVLVLQLRDEGRLALDDPIGRFVPETGYASATVHDLLAHTAGLQSEPVGAWWERVDGGAVAELLEANDGSGRVAAAGEYYHYSNLGFALLGEAVARLRGAPWWQVVQSRLLAPLGMGATSYDPPADHAPGRSVDHFAHTLSAEPHSDTRAMAPAGQLWSTVGDLLVWADFLATGHPDVLASATLAEMARPATPAEAYGLGLRVLHAHGRTLVGHTGSMPGFQASLFVDRSTRDAVVALADSTTGLGAEQVPSRFLAAGDGAPVAGPVTPWRPSPRPVPATVGDVLGIWFWGHTGFSIEWRDAELQVRDLRTGSLEERLRPEGEVFVGTDGYHRGETLYPRRRADGSLSHLECATFVWTRTPYDPQAPIPGGPAPQA
ncbi:serine hydrolase domain-containing protein [Nocardioides daeguensis]|uniref:Serine hydrolase domain-containing protein n=1 Tax=Nocardioides daeguensis TaxID=908359 RepID=A0ABP6V1F8_9ACTN|nr:serine hydrolase domain-containing protein [Nocardioides daeguensis]MBV6729712.1 beta-lactamase family protein [Nocardioides daeguensis]MCR1774683.1 beta-lactamase family protein [Nocardioides daeguensis]